MSSVAGLLNQLRWPLLLSVVLPILSAAVFYFPNKEKIDSRLFGLRPMDRSITKIAFVLLWAGIPLACVLLLDGFGIAPLASQRYALVGSAAIPLFAGLCVGVSGKWYGQLAIAAILTATSFVQGYERQQIIYNPIVAHFQATQSLPMLRLENWKDTIAEINRRQDKQTHPVFLYANLIEDVDAFANADPAFQEYLRFPISGIHTVDRTVREVIAAPTLGVQHFRPTDIELMKQQGGAWLIIRTRDPGFVGVICDELRQLAVLLAEIEQETSPDPTDAADGVQPSAQFIRFPMSPLPSQSVYLSDVYLVSINW